MDSLIGADAHAAPSPGPRDRGASLARLARRLLAASEAGVVRVAVVGLSEREAVQFLTGAATYGLQPKVTRGERGQLYVSVIAPSVVGRAVSSALVPSGKLRTPGPVARMATSALHLVVGVRERLR